MGKSRNKEDMTILVVDDEEPVRMAIRALLSKEGYKVVDAENYKEALEVVNHAKIDLMLLDIMMPQVDGVSVAHITKHAAFLEQSFPIIFVSGKSKDTVDLQNADGFIQKPFQNKEFLRYIDDMLAKWDKKTS